MRTLITPYGTFRYRIGLFTTVIVPPEGKKLVVDHNVLTGRSWDTIERGRWKKTCDGMITPGHVRAYLDKLGGLS